MGRLRLFVRSLQAPVSDDELSLSLVLNGLVTQKQIKVDIYYFIRDDPRPSKDVVAGKQETLLGEATTSALERVRMPMKMPVHPDYRKILSSEGRRQEEGSGGAEPARAYPSC